MIYGMYEPNPEQMVDEALDYAAECAAKADPRFAQLKNEKRLALQQKTAGPKPVEVVQRPRAGSGKKEK